MLTWWTVRKLRSSNEKVRSSTLDSLRAVQGEKLIAGVLPLLTNCDWMVRRAAKRALESCQPPLHESNSARDFVPDLIAAVSKGENEEAIWALGRIRTPRAADVLSRVSPWKSSEVTEALLAICSVETAPAILRFSEHCVDRKALEQPLTSLGPPVLPALREALKARHWQIRDLALNVLGGIPEARPDDFVPLLADDICEIRQKAAERLHNRGWQPSSETQAACAHVARRDWAKAVAMGGVAIAPLARELSCHPLEAVRALGQIGGDQIVPPIAGLFRGIGRPVPDQILFKGVIEALLNGGESGLRLLIDLGTREDFAKEIAPLLLKIGSPALPSLLRAGEQGNSFAFQMLGLMGDPRVIPVLESALWGNNRWSAKDALVAMKHTPTVPRNAAVIAVLNEDWPAVEALGEVAIDAIIASNPFGSNAEAITALERIGTVAARDYLFKLASSSPSVPVAEALARLGDTRVLPLLIGTLDRPWARNIVAAFGPQALDLLLPLFDKKFEQAQQADATVVLSGEQAIPFVLRLLSQDNWIVRMHGAMIAGEIGDFRVIAPLVTLLDNAETAVRRAAVTALRNLHWLPPSPAMFVDWLAAAEQWDDLAKCGESAVPVLVTWLRHIQARQRDLDSRYRVVACLSAIRSRQAVLPLVEFFRWFRKERPWDDIAGVCTALGDLGDTSAVPALIEALEVGDEPWRDNIRRAAIAASANLADVRTLPALTALATHSSVAEEAVNAIAQIVTACAGSLLLQELQPLAHLTSTKVLWTLKHDSDNYHNDHWDKLGEKRIPCDRLHQLAHLELQKRQIK